MVKTAHVATANDLITLVLNRTTKDFQFETGKNGWQKTIFVGALGLFALSAVLGVLSWWFERAGITIAAIVAFYLGAFFVFAYQASLLGSEMRKLKNPEREIISPLANTFIDSMDLIHELAASFQPHQLSYAHAVFERGAKQLRERIGIFVGALEKVGAFPLLITAYLSYLEWSKNGASFGSIELVGIAIAGFYLFAIRMILTAQWMESVAALYAHALQRVESTRRGDTTPEGRRVLTLDRHRP